MSNQLIQYTLEVGSDMGISGGFLEADTCRVVSCEGRYHLTVRNPRGS